MRDTRRRAVLTPVKSWQGLARQCQDRRLMAKFDQAVNPTNPRPDITLARPTPEDTKVELPPGATAEDRDAANAKVRKNLGSDPRPPLNGRNLTAEDVGTTQADMDLIRSITPYVTGTSEALGGSGDPSPATAWGVYHVIYETKGYWFRSPEAYEIDGNFRASMYMRPAAIWAMEMTEPPVASDSQAGASASK